MPTTVLKNFLYRAALPFLAPACGKHPLSGISGHRIRYTDDYVRLLRKHHVIGSATLLSYGKDRALIFSSSDHPVHQANENTYFRVASITKIATAVLTMLTIDMGLASLDETVCSYLPISPAPEELTGVTLRHLLSHTSGLMDPPGLEKALENRMTIDELIHGLRISRPGTLFRYSNLGFGIVGCVLEAVYNLPLDEVFSKYLFQPLQMNATLSGCSLSPDCIMPVARILPYHPGNDLILTPLGRIPLDSPDPLRHFGHSAGSLYTDINSLYSLLKVLLNGKSGFLSDNALSEMKRKHASYGRISPTLSYGLGLLQVEDKKLSSNRILGHQGFAYGCADGAFWEEGTGKLIIFLNGGCSEARSGRLGTANKDMISWAFRKELPVW